jgi:hypothetical protein
MLVWVVVARHGLGERQKQLPSPVSGPAGSSIEISRKAESKTEFSVTHEASLQRPTLHASSRKNHLHSYGADERFFTPKEGFSYGPLDPHRKALLGDSNAALLPYGKGWLQQPMLT